MSDLVPKDWSVTTLNSNASLITDGSHFSPLTVESGKPIATVQNMRGRHIDIASCRLISNEKFEELVKGNCLPQYGDVLFSKDGTIGKTFVYKQNQSIVLLSSIAIIRLRQENFSPDYCTQYLQSPLFYQQLENAKSGSAIKRVVLKDIKELKLPTPPLPEQQRIAAILTSVDEVIEKTQAQINKLKDLKTGMMQELLTRGVGVDGKPHTEFKDSPVGRIPKGWEVVPLSSLAIAKGLQTGPFGGQLHAEEYTEKGIPVIMPKNMKSNNVSVQNIARIPEDKAIELSKHRVTEGDIVFSRRGDIGRFVLINKESEGWLCGTGSLRARLNKVTILPLYLASYLTLDLVIEWLNNNAVGQTMLNLNTSILGELPVVLPSIHEQELIANSIESIDRRLGILSNKLTKIQDTKKALMQDLLTGKVRVKVDS